MVPEWINNASVCVSIGSHGDKCVRDARLPCLKLLARVTRKKKKNEKKEHSFRHALGSPGSYEILLRHGPLTTCNAGGTSSLTGKTSAYNPLAAVVVRNSLGLKPRRGPLFNERVKRGPRGGGEGGKPIPITRHILFRQWFSNRGALRKYVPDSTRYTRRILLSCASELCAITKFTNLHDGRRNNTGVTPFQDFAET